MILTFTGPSELSRSQELAVVRYMEKLSADPMASDRDVWRSGCAFGVDTIAARQAIVIGVLGVELYVPAAPHNEKLVKELDGRASRIYRCGNGKEPYRRRNEIMTKGSLGVDKADLLVAFLKSDTFYRSGEWMTVNIAKRVGVPVEMIII
jgi:hypothetical protein